jgi:hypothetical protein
LPTPAPPGGAPVASWLLTGGFTMPGMQALRPPRLVIYADGETIADAAYRSRIESSELSALLEHLVADLRSPDVGKRKSASPTIADTPTTVFKVWAGSSTLTVSADGLDEFREIGMYASSLYDIRDRLGTVYKDVVATAQPYLADRVRVVTELTTAGNAAPWPQQLQVPKAADPASDDVKRADLDGQAARDAVRLLTRDLDQRGAWPTYRTPDGQLVRASWRYLLPNE